MRSFEKSKEKRSAACSQQTVLVDLLQAELLVELGHASAGIHQLLLTGEEGVTLRADFHLDILLGRTCLNHITAGASNSSLLIIGMDSFLHARVHLFPYDLLRGSFHHHKSLISVTYNLLECKHFLNIFLRFFTI